MIVTLLPGLLVLTRFNDLALFQGHWHQNRGRLLFFEFFFFFKFMSTVFYMLCGCYIHYKDQGQYALCSVYLITLLLPPPPTFAVECVSYECLLFLFSQIMISCTFLVSWAAVCFRYTQTQTVVCVCVTVFWNWHEREMIILNQVYCCIYPEKNLSCSMTPAQTSKERQLCNNLCWYSDEACCEVVWFILMSQYPQSTAILH